MQPEKKEGSKAPQPATKTGKSTNTEHVKEAHEQADADIEKDPDFMPGNEADDLDEAESVKLNDDENDLV